MPLRLTRLGPSSRAAWDGGDSASAGGGGGDRSRPPKLGIARAHAASEGREPGSRPRACETNSPKAPGRSGRKSATLRNRPSSRSATSSRNDPGWSAGLPVSSSNRSAPRLNESEAGVGRVAAVANSSGAPNRATPANPAGRSARMMWAGIGGNRARCQVPFSNRTARTQSPQLRERPPRNWSRCRTASASARVSAIEHAVAGSVVVVITWRRSAGHPAAPGVTSTTRPVASTPTSRIVTSAGWCRCTARRA